MAFLTDLAVRYVRIRILLLPLFAVVVGTAALLSPFLADGGALLVGFGAVAVATFALSAVYAVRR